MNIFNLLKRKKEVIKEYNQPCPKCGTVDCISIEEYQQRIKISNIGVLSVDSNDLVRCCSFRQQMDLMDEIEKDNPGIWGVPFYPKNSGRISSDDDVDP